MGEKRRSANDARQDLRRKLGVILNRWREMHNLNKKDVRDGIGLGNSAYNEVENGDQALPPEWLPVLASFYEMTRQQEKVFAKEVLRCTNPAMFAMLFDSSDPDLQRDVDDLGQKSQASLVKTCSEFNTNIPDTIKR